MSKQQKQMKKRKEREQKSKDKVLKIREKIRAEAKEKADEIRLEKRIRKLKKTMDEYEFYNENFYRQLPPNVLGQLEHNARILKALEDEYTVAEIERRERAEEMEKLGLVTLEDKMDALQQYAKREVSDVEVIKAPVEPTEGESDERESTDD